MTVILSETFAPPRMAQYGCSGDSSARERNSISFCDQEAGGGLAHRLRDGDHGGVGPVAGAEGVVDVEVAERGDLRGEGGVALLLLGVEAEVLEEDDFAGLQRGAGLGDRRADAVGQEADRLAQQLGEPLPRRAPG